MNKHHLKHLRKKFKILKLNLLGKKVKKIYDMEIKLEKLISEIKQ